MGEEARTGKRFPLELPIKIHQGQTVGNAVTGNLSAAGVYIRADSSMEIGSPVEFEITLPPEMTGGQENVTIQCKGRVVRADETGEGGEGRGVPRRGTGAALARCIGARAGTARDAAIRTCARRGGRYGAGRCARFL